MALDEEYASVRGSLKAQAEKEKLAAQRRLQQQMAGGRLGANRAQKIGAITEGEIGSRLEQQLGDVNFQEAQQKRQEEEIKKQQQFATSEREAAQQYGTQERMGAQQFAATESALARMLQNDQFEKQLALQDKEFAENLKSNIFNKIISISQTSPGRLDDVLYSLGFRAPSRTDVFGNPIQNQGAQNTRFRLPESGAF